MVSPSTSRLPSLAAARTAWRRLAPQQDNIFATWEWADAWWRAFGHDHELFVHEVLDAERRTIGILPLYIAATPFVRLVRYIGHGPADQLGPLCRREHRQPVAAALRDLMRASNSPRVLLAERMRADEGWEEALGGRHVRRDGFPLIKLDGLGWESWLATKSANFRQHARKAERRLARDHRLEYRLVTDEEQVPAALETLISLHNARWGGESGAFSPSRRAFHQDFAETAAKRGWLRIWLAVVNGSPAAAWMGYRFGDIESSYQMGRAPAWSGYDIGFILRLHAIREACPEVREFRLLLGREPYKERLASADPELDTCLVGTGAVPWIAHKLAQHKRRLPAPARRLIGSRLGW